MRKRVWKRLLACCCAAAILPWGLGSGIDCKAEDNKKTKIQSSNDNLKLWYNSPSKINTSEGAGGDWMKETLPLGNGNLGNLIFGGVSKERIHFNEKTLWTGGPSPNRPDYEFGNKQTAYTADEIEAYRNLLDDKTTNVFNDDPALGNPGTSGIIRFPGENNLNKGEYQDFGDIYLDYSPSGIKEDSVKNYRRELNLQNGIAATEYAYRGVTYKREHFVSSPDNVMVTRLTASETRKLSVNINMQLSNKKLTQNISADDTQNTMTIAGEVKDNGLKFRTTLKIIPSGGTISFNDEKKQYEVVKADSIMLVMAAETDYLNEFPTYRDTDKNLEEVVNQRLDACETASYDELKQRHIEDHMGLFERVKLDLGESAPNIPTNQLVDKYRKGEYSKYLEVLSFQYGRYLTIAGSRGTLPSNLVGLWTVGPSAWTGDYHFNVNVQMNYWPVYVTNLAECGVTMVDYMDKLRAPGRLTAERVHGITGATTNHTGFTVHTENNPFGMTAPSKNQEYGWNPTGAAWAVQNIWQYYEFTQDQEYLESTIYPIMKEAAQFWDQYLWVSNYQKIEESASAHNGENRLVVAPSFSEEQGPTVVGSTYDQSLVWELYKECIEAGSIVDEDPELLAKWQDNMERLDPVNISATNGIKEWYEETRVGKVNGQNHSFAQAGNLPEIPVPNSGWNIGHPGEQRHASHLVGLYPGTLINKENTEYMSAAIQSLNERGFYSTGWSKANKVNLWARTGDGDSAYKVLNNLIGGNSSGLQYNLFDSHGSGGGETMMNGNPVWQIDGNYGLTAGVAEMLVQSQLGYTQFLPAIPKAWSDGSVEGLKARGNFTIGETWANGLAENFTVCYEGSEEQSTFTGEYASIVNAEVLQNGNPVEVVKDEANGRISFEAKQGVTYTIKMTNENIGKLIEDAKAFLAELHPDLTEVSKELTTAISDQNANLGTILQKAKVMNSTYAAYLGKAELVYYLTNQEALSNQDIDVLYNDLRAMRQTLLDNSMDLDYYRQLQTRITDIAAVLDGEMKNRMVSFSKESGPVSGDSETVTLSKSADAPNYVIRYTEDGTEPRTASEEYKAGIELSNQKNTTVRAALFYREQRVSPIYSKQYTAGSIRFESVEISNNSNWGATYAKDKMIDGDASTRWAFKKPLPAEPLEIELTLSEVQEINKLNFNFFVSSANGIGPFEIHAYADGKYQKIYEGTKLGDINDRVGNADGGSGGYHAYKEIGFPTVNTNKIKVVLKPAFLGEPSVYEITAMMLKEIKDIPGDQTELKETIQLADAADRTAAFYLEADESLRNAFEGSILDGKDVKELTQAALDSRSQFINNLYFRLGFGVTDKLELEALLAQADEAMNGSYTRDSKYRLNKVLAGAKAIYEDAEARQPAVDKIVQELKDAISYLEDASKTTVMTQNQLTGSSEWIEVGAYRATNSDTAGSVAYEFTGTGLKVLTINAADHGIIGITITDENGNVVHSEEVDTYAAIRNEGAVLIEKSDLQEMKYTITFTRIGNSPSNPAGRASWVEVGDMTVMSTLTEEVDRSALAEELGVCNALIEAEYTAQSWSAFATVLGEAQVLFQKTDEETCTSEMEDMSGKLAEARGKLVVFVDVSELQETLAGAKEIKPDGYTAASYEALSKTILEVESFLQGSYTADEVMAKTALLKQAISNLRADMSQLQNKYNEIKDKKQENVTDESWKEFEALRAEVKKALEDQTLTPDAVAELIAKVDAFEFKYKDEHEEPNPDPDNPDKPNNGNTNNGQSGNTNNGQQGNANSVVKTGDTVMIWIPMLTLLVSMVAIAGYIIQRKRRSIE
ncbi:MAG: glycoside hydrolase N-terminal domain-containing protein [Hespellia sp.]|nr:glycoside hydrolase N-terminal domain-containing protein [Hespellia sp.]